MTDADKPPTKTIALALVLGDDKARRLIAAWHLVAPPPHWFDDRAMTEEVFETWGKLADVHPRLIARRYQFRLFRGRFLYRDGSGDPTAEWAVLQVMLDTAPPAMRTYILTRMAELEGKQAQA